LIEEKLRIVAEAEAPGAVISLVARRHGVARSQIFDWRRQVRSGELALVSVRLNFFRCG
jgi:transposase